jgi:HPt (histidine-containing phosphotransfer) domain-containing protein
VNPENIIDMTTFSELREATGDEFLAELIDTYCEETPQLLAELQAALARLDAEAFRRHAHSIKSSSATFGAASFAAQARELEYLGRDRALGQVGDRAERLAANYATVERTLRELAHAT